MKKIIFIFTAILVSVMLGSCDSDAGAGAEEQTIEETLKDRSDEWKRQSFVIPDTINTALIIATYYEANEAPDHFPGPPGHSIILYNDTNKKTASRIKYCDDSTVVKDDLITINNNTFQSKYIQGETYAIKEKTVAWIYQDGNLSTSREFTRTDRDIN